MTAPSENVCVYMCAYQGVRNISLSKYFAHVLNEFFIREYIEVLEKYCDNKNIKQNRHLFLLKANAITKHLL